jgi:hypothetical protein
MVAILRGPLRHTNRLGRTASLVVWPSSSSLNAISQGSELRIQFTTDARYQAFLKRAVDATVLGIRVRDVTLPGDVTDATPDGALIFLWRA